MSALRFVGFDTSVTACGMVAGGIELTEGDKLHLRLTAAQVIATEKDDSFRLRTDDMRRRVQLLARGTLEFTRANDPHVITAETPALMSGKTSVLTVSGLGRVFGLVEMLGECTEGATFITTRANELKAALGVEQKRTRGLTPREKDALKKESKAAMVAAALERFPELAVLLEGVKAKHHEHVADAVASVVAALPSVEFRQRLKDHLRLSEVSAELEIDDLQRRGALWALKEGTP